MSPYVHIWYNTVYRNTLECISIFGNAYVTLQLRTLHFAMQYQTMYKGKVALDADVLSSPVPLSPPTRAHRDYGACLATVR